MKTFLQLYDTEVGLKANSENMKLLQLSVWYKKASIVQLCFESLQQNMVIQQLFCLDFITQFYS